MTKKDFENLFIDAINALRKSGIVPIDTGNLAYNAIKGIWITDTLYRIYIDERVAEYAPYTIEAWDKGQNPNEGWLERAWKFVANYIAVRLGGKIG